MKAMVSQPMNGRSNEEILAERSKAVSYLKGLGYEVVDTFFEDGFDELIKSKDVINEPVFYLGKALEKMSECTAVLFCQGWEQARGCLVEYRVASKYGLDVFFLPDRFYESAT